MFEEYGRKKAPTPNVIHLSLVSWLLFRDSSAKIRGALKAVGGPVFSKGVFVPGRGSLGLKGWLCLGALSPLSCKVDVTSDGVRLESGGPSLLLSS